MAVRALQTENLPGIGRDTASGVLCDGEELHAQIPGLVDVLDLFRV